MYICILLAIWYAVGYQLLILIIDCMPSYKLWLSATDQHHESIILHINSQEKIKIQNLKYDFY